MLKGCGDDRPESASRITRHALLREEQQKVIFD